MSQQEQGIYEFGAFRLDVGEGVLLREGHPVSLQWKTFETLCVLVKRSGHLVTRDELMDELWHDTFVEENNLAQHIRALRKALGEGENGSVFIETVPRRGYRFLPEVRVVNNENDADAALFVAPQTPQQSASWLKPFAVVTVLVLFIVGVVGWNSLNRRRNNQIAPSAALTLQTMQVERLTAKGKVYDPAISPDGKFLAYTVRDGAKQSLWLRDLATKSETQLIPPTQMMYGTLSFAPDGGSLYFWGREGGKDGAAYQIPLLGGAARKIAEGLRSGLGLSPDGKQLAYIRFDGNQYILSVCNVDGSSERIVTTRSGKFSYYTWGLAPAWSPDGNRLVVSAGELKDEKQGDAQERYFVEVNVADGREKRLASPSWSSTDMAVWLPDGSGLIVIAQERRGAPYQLWHLSYTDGAAQRITNDLNDYSKVSLTADGETLVASQETHNANIWILPDADASRARRITHVTSDTEGFTRWTPDGRLIFHSNEGGLTNLWVMDADGGNRRQLTFEESPVNSPQVTPDGRHILFTSARNGVSHIWQVEIDGRNPQPVTDGDGERLLDLTPDGRWLIYAGIKHWTWTLWKRPIEGGEAVRLSEQLYESAEVSPDGKQVVFGYYDKRAADGTPWKRAIMPFDGSAPPKLLDLPPALAQCDWSTDGQSLYLLKKGEPMNVWQYSLDGKLRTQATDFPAEAPGYIEHFAWSPDGKQLAVTRIVKLSDAILISDFR